MPKGYWVAHVTVNDPLAYEAYRRANAAAFQKYGGRFLVRGSEGRVAEGEMPGRTVVVEFPSVEAAHACYDSPEYRRALALRLPCSTANLAIFAGWDANS
ncbi:DUF1330 domain-containing protein [Paracoccus endophyticus]|uniref:DUF1330 domain-containing protein n=1 Tax=Paracoccus endophyticus TaxID=2233774 RepID=UPI000DD9CD3A|nr:DUF1330 domain-containing protein [Paracoccus endophyticus]